MKFTYTREWRNSEQRDTLTRREVVRLMDRYFTRNPGMLAEAESIATKKHVPQRIDIKPYYVLVIEERNGEA